MTDGTLLSMSLRNDDGTDVDGELSAGQRRWSTTEPLGSDKRYTWSGIAFDDEGKRFPIEGSFRTLVPKAVVGIQPNVVDGGVYHRTSPVVLRFSTPVGDGRAVRRAPEITPNRAPPARGRGVRTTRSSRGVRSGDGNRAPPCACAAAGTRCE